MLYQAGSGLIYKHCIRLERLARDKNSSLLDPFVSCEENSVANTALYIYHKH